MQFYCFAASILLFEFGTIFKKFFFLRRILLCSPRLHSFDQKHSKNSDTVKYYNLN